MHKYLELQRPHKKVGPTEKQDGLSRRVSGFVSFMGVVHATKEAPNTWRTPGLVSG